MSHPSQVVVDAVAAIQRADWNAFINLCDPVSVRRFKNDLVWQFSDHGHSSLSVVDEIMDDLPELSREDLEDCPDWMNRRRDPEYRLSLELSTISSVEELRSLSPDEVLIRWLKSRMLRSDSDFSSREWKGQEIWIPEVDRIPWEELDELSWKPEYVVLGSVRDGPEFAQVVCRHADRRNRDEEDPEDCKTPRDESELDQALENRTFILTALCRRQPDGTWRLIAERNLFFLPNTSVVT